MTERFIDYGETLVHMVFDPSHDECDRLYEADCVKYGDRNVSYMKVIDDGDGYYWSITLPDTTN